MKKLFALAIILALPLQATAAFSDVTEDNQYYEAITYLETAGAISTQDNFNPDSTVKRCEFFKMLLGNAGFTPEDASGENHFTDITGDEWYAPYANKAAEIGLIKITSTNKTFNPEKEITKGEAAKLIMTWGGFAIPMYLSEEDMTTSYRDLTYRNIYAPYIELALSIGVIDGRDENYFGTQSKITRGETAQMLYSFDGYMATDEYVDYLAYNNIDIANIPYVDILSDVYTKLTNNYYGGGLNEEELMYGAIEGMVETIDDVHTIFSEPVEAEVLSDTLSGNYVGIGTYLDQEEDGDIIITGTIENSPAQEQELQADDIIRAVDGEPTAGKSLEEVSAMIKGEAGTDVILTIERLVRGETQTLEITLTRREITIEYIHTEILDNQFLYCKIDYFGETVGEDFRTAIDTELSEHNIKGLILDVRNNPGGYVTTANSIMSNFIKENDYEVIIHYNNSNTIYLSEGPADLAQYPTVILTNEHSASASEILAATMQEYGLAEIVGTQSYGKGTVQEIFYYYDGSSIKYTVAHWLTPNRVDVNGIGVTPDVFVEDDTETEDDEQLEEAIDTLEEMLD
ncbi:MAG: hypothetical protein ACD_51C00060G0003 [uncultured bacterium]|nr:MAG: hypothetical protein ACD_51C00060G0003 [uncultured bacterium]OGJ47770.1 MAG: hypothetical protein A2244_03955 [Candidatus Peregrinibacteria bacterium RIFOXYA2_FULL_41_18]OGJ49080.1 MAG: hypothetical protein A2344_05865 [Candidatus Peregrinibacteria bacterium RIFOXYB12_FULL_41_12]OGJ53016.1 MAG: hypothetical protein A2336_04280 [Candidatus Peregrinibacteria bacterium RIFOXYB2_FULL_41_88]OGJ53548.1 MAG: hypothetical protein A2448_04505 [Candidatus Peregrinibacteria bacterium RIFOXYC2_FULL